MSREVPRPWIFGIAAIPFGAFNGFVAIALPYLLRRHGLSVERIASISALVQAPAVWYFLWAPAVDVGLRRRSWIVLLAIASGLCAALALAVGVATSVRTATTLLVGASVLNQPVSSAVGGLVAAVMPDGERGRTAGWTQAGILGGGVVAGGAAIALLSYASVYAVAAMLALLIAAPAFAALAVNEPSPERAGLREQLAHMLRQVVAMLRRREVWVAALFFLSPVGAGALMNLFSAIAVDFHASGQVVIWGVAIGGLMTTLGALGGGYILDRYDRWLCYPLAGFAAAAVLGAMLLAPLRPATYLVGAAAYALVTGFAYAVFMALALELLGSETAASGTRFTLLMAAVTVPVVYMLRLDGLGHAHYGVRGMLATDGIANAGAGVLLMLVLTTLAPRARSRPRRAL